MAGFDSDRFRHVIRPFVRKFDLETDLQETIIVFRPRNQNQLCVQMMILAIVTKILKNTKKSTIYWMDLVRDGIWVGVRRHINRLIRESKDIGLEFSRNYKLTSFVQLKLYRGDALDLYYNNHP